MKPGLPIAALCAALSHAGCASDDATQVVGGSGASTGAGGGAGGVVGDGGWPDAAAGANSGGSPSGGTSSGGTSSGGAGGTTAGGACTNLSAWKSSAAFADAAHVSHPLPSFGVAGFFYVHTMDSSAGERVLYSAKQTSDGSLSAFQLASADHGGGPHGFTAVVVGTEPYHFRNGHIARYPLDSNGKMTGDVVLKEANPDTAFGGNRYVWDSAVFAAFSGGGSTVIHLGGFSFTGYTYKPNVYRSAVPLQPTFTSTGVNHPATRPGRAQFWSPPGANYGYVFSGEGGGSKYWRAKVVAGGAFEPWTELGTLPSGTDNERGDWFVIDGTLFVIRGAKVFGARIDAQGTLAPFQAQPPLPDAQIDISWGQDHLEGASYAVLGDYVYVTGKKTVLYSHILRNQPCPP
ncbi:MAG: hypothetical protein IPI67_25955 [Myxococcales bacterium]|nr:hypothetical protein [Myxococcales bacterium]